MLIHAYYEYILIKKINIMAYYAIKGRSMIIFDSIYFIVNASFIYFVSYAFDDLYFLDILFGNKYN